MEFFEYLPQLIIAYNGNDEFAHLIHVRKAEQDTNYFCPCCGGIVRPRALENVKEQSHYYHITGKCSKKSQLHFFCRNWLFEPKSKFYIDGKLFEIKGLEIEKKWNTKFGDYVPDVTVYSTSGETIYFEIFFSNRKTEDNYFCKWEALGNDVVEINIKEFMLKTDVDVIPTFIYLYHAGQCYSKSYIKRDLYAITIAKTKNELARQKVLDYKTRIEQLNWFWQKITENVPKKEIINCIHSMPYKDMLSCYEIIKRKHCVSYLKEDILREINQKTIETIRNSIDLPFDEHVYLDIEHVKGKTYEIGIRLNIKTKHIVYDKFYLHCDYKGWDFEKSVGYPKIVFKKNIFTVEEIKIPKDKIAELKEISYKTVQYKNRLVEYEKELSDFENNGYKVRFHNNQFTVLRKTQNHKYEPILKNHYMKDLNTELLLQEVHRIAKEKTEKNFIKGYINSEKAQALISALENYKNIGVKVCIEYKNHYYNCQESDAYFHLYLYGSNIYNRILSTDEADFLEIIENSKNKMDVFIDKYRIVIELVSKINNCKNKFWKAELLFDFSGELNIRIDQTYIGRQIWHMTYEEINLSKINLSNKESICNILAEKMQLVMKNMEKYGCRAMEVQYS